MKRPAYKWILMGLLLAVVVACGKKGPLEQPADVETDYPRNYPSQE
ncbi:MAG: hypothetical protein HON43_02560 [Alphaproteobacteria bacterium]|jgi:predicted small lipoprotein YifL|nr:hypothetical protein [Alphaproteobacteria bacterium]MBT5390433.1 hypothetical protein [Alphaproteobacteria bacterium]MBT5540732.1 hypothetical protein [Alphaproteobacteria bacterium]